MSTWRNPNAMAGLRLFASRLFPCHHSNILHQPIMGWKRQTADILYPQKQGFSGMFWHVLVYQNFRVELRNYCPPKLWASKQF